MPDKTISTRGRATKAAAKFDLAEVIDHAEQMKAADTKRDTMYRSIDEMYLMTWAGRGGKKWVNAEIKVSPDARNAALGAVRLLVATDPIFNVVNSKEKQEAVEKIEKAAGQIWDAAGRVAGNPLHYDALLSAILYSEIHAAITSTSDLVAAASKKGKGEERAKRLERITPFLIDIWNPMDGHAEFDSMGLSAYYREVDTTAGRLKSDFGDLLPDDLENLSMSDTVTLKTYYDLEKTVIWANDKVIVAEEHKLPFIPVCVQYTEGSKLWKKPEEARQPLLYTLLKSGMWDMQNMTLSVLYTLIRDMGLTPLYAHNTPQGMDGKPLDIDYDNTPAVVHLVAGEGFAPLQNKGLIDPAVAQGLDIATQKLEESTIYRQALGAQVTGESTYSELALLTQSGRLPLVGSQRRGGWGIGAIMEMCLEMLRAGGSQVAAGAIDLKPSDIPEYVQVDAKLDIKLPQDKLQMANIARILAEGDDPLTDHEWVRENILNIPKSGEMQRKIWAERAANMMFQDFLQKQFMQNVPPTGGEIPPQNPPPEAMSQQPMMTAEQIEMMKGGGIPPEQAGLMPGGGNPFGGLGA